MGTDRVDFHPHLFFGRKKGQNPNVQTCLIFQKRIPQFNFFYQKQNKTKNLKNNLCPLCDLDSIKKEKERETACLCEVADLGAGCFIGRSCNRRGFATEINS